MTDFDPYYKWLAIPPDQRPISHYDLLGLRRFESDVDVIINAAEQRMVHVKSFANGPYAEDSQRILNELSRAKICLANSESRDAYDATLKSSRTEAKVVQPTIPQPVAAATMVPPVTEPSSVRVTPSNFPYVNVASHRRRSSGGISAAFLAIGMLVLISAPVGWFLLRSMMTVPPQIVVTTTNNPPDSPSATNQPGTSNDEADDSLPTSPEDVASDTLPSSPEVGPTDSNRNPSQAGNSKPDANPKNLTPNTSGGPRESQTIRPRSSDNDQLIGPNRKPPRNTSDPNQNTSSPPDRSPIMGPSNPGDATEQNDDARVAELEADKPLPPGLINELDSGLNAIFEHRYLDYRNHVSYARSIALNSRLRKAMNEVRYLESYFNAYNVVWDEVQTSIKSLQAGSQIKIGSSVASVVEARPQQLILFANRVHRKYLGRRAGTSIVFYDMPKPLIMHLSRLPNTQSQRVQQSLTFIDKVDPSALPSDPKERWEYIKTQWIDSGAQDDISTEPGDSPASNGSPPGQEVTPVQQATLIKSPDVHTNRFDFDNSEGKRVELTNLDPTVERMEVLRINLGRTLGRFEVPEKLRYLESGKKWRLEGERQIPVTLVLDFQSGDDTAAIHASATYKMVMSRSQREYPLHLPDIRKKMTTVEGAIKRHQRKGNGYQLQINQLKQQIASVAKTRVPQTGPGALVAAQQKQATLNGLNEQLRKKAGALNSVAKQLKRSEAQLNSYKSIIRFGQEMQSDGWIQVKVINK